MTPDEFKETFRVGDFIRGWSTRKLMQITAIGESRFLYRDFRGSDREWVAAMENVMARWEKDEEACANDPQSEEPVP